MVTYSLDKNSKVTEAEKFELSEARKKPVIYDEDSPEMTDDMERAFIEARKRKPIRGQKVTLYISDASMSKAKMIGADYIAVLSKLLDKAVRDYGL